MWRLCVLAIVLGCGLGCAGFGEQEQWQAWKNGKGDTARLSSNGQALDGSGGPGF